MTAVGRELPSDLKKRTSAFSQFMFGVVLSFSKKLEKYMWGVY
jgi:hypothetical protein